MTVKETALTRFKSWYAGLPIQKNGIPARGTISAALVVLEHLKDSFDLELSSHLAPGGAQISGVSRFSVNRILAKFGENRPFLSEGGRTNRGGPGNIASMLESLRDIGLDSLDEADRKDTLDALQEFLVERVRDYHSRERLKVVFNPSQSAWQSIHDLLEESTKTGKQGAVAQYLVGAKLQLRFPEIVVGNESFSTADAQLERHGDFCIGDTVFHVTVAPMPGLYQKIKANIDEGFRVYLLVPDNAVIGARQNAEAVAPGRVAVESIESFVGGNLEELAIFRKDRLAEGFLRLLKTYNERVDATELDKSVLIEIPRNLQRLDASV